MDVDTVADELYGLRPEAFTGTRNERAKQARSRGQKDIARHIGQLRKPTASAWVVNLLVREASGEVDQLLQLGEQLREAQTELQGEELRALSQRRAQVVSALAGQGRRLAREAGHAVSESVGREVERTLEAALADPDAAASVRSGRLTAPLSYSGLGPVSDAGGSRSQPTQPTRARRSPGQRAARGRGGATTAEERRRATEEGRHAEIAEARRAVSEAEEVARHREEERDRAQRSEEDLRSRKEAAAERVAELESELDKAREGAASIAAELEDASRRRKEAARALAEAQQRVEEARNRREQLSDT